jgi:hypothetical protein
MPRASKMYVPLACGLPPKVPSHPFPISLVLSLCYLIRQKSFPFASKRLIFSFAKINK